MNEENLSPGSMLKAIAVYGIGLRVIMVLFPIWVPFFLIWIQIYYVIKAYKSFNFSKIETLCLIGFIIVIIAWIHS